MNFAMRGQEALLWVLRAGARQVVRLGWRKLLRRGWRTVLCVGVVIGLTMFLWVRDGHAAEGIVWGDSIRDGNVSTLQTSVNALGRLVDSVEDRTIRQDGQISYIKSVVVVNQNKIDLARSAISDVQKKLDSMAAVDVETQRRVSLNRQDQGKQTQQLEGLAAAVAYQKDVAIATQNRVNQANGAVQQLVQHDLPSMHANLRSVASDMAKGFAQLSASSTGGGGGGVGEIADDLGALRGSISDAKCQQPKRAQASPWAMIGDIGRHPADGCLANQAIVADSVDRVILALRTMDKRAEDDEKGRQGDADSLERAIIDLSGKVVQVGQGVRDELREQIGGLGQNNAPVVIGEKTPDASKQGQVVDWTPAKLPKTGAWLGSLKCLESTLSGLDGGKLCGAGPTLDIAGVKMQPLSYCGPDFGLQKLKTIIGACLVISGVAAFLRALLSAFGMGEAVPGA